MNTESYQLISPLKLQPPDKHCLGNQQKPQKLIFFFPKILFLKVDIGVGYFVNEINFHLLFKIQ